MFRYYAYSKTGRKTIKTSKRINSLWYFLAKRKAQINAGVAIGLLYLGIVLIVSLVF